VVDVRAHQVIEVAELEADFAGNVLSLTLKILPCTSGWFASAPKALKCCQCHLNGE
jgi:hypothetical protein